MVTAGVIAAGLAGSSSSLLLLLEELELAASFIATSCTTTATPGATSITASLTLGFSSSSSESLSLSELSDDSESASSESEEELLEESSPAAEVGTVCWGLWAAAGAEAGVGASSSLSEEEEEDELEELLLLLLDEEDELEEDEDEDEDEASAFSSLQYHMPQRQNSQLQLKHDRIRNETRRERERNSRLPVTSNELEQTLETLSDGGRRVEVDDGLAFLAQRGGRLCVASRGEEGVDQPVGFCARANERREGSAGWKKRGASKGRRDVRVRVSLSDMVKEASEVDVKGTSREIWAKVVGEGRSNFLKA
jgi:hypothetical protein